MLGKRCRSVRGGVAMGLECFPVDAIAAAAEQSVEKQVSPKCGSPCAHRLIVGFDLKASPDKQHENCLLLEKQSASTKSCRPTSGLESLLSSPRTQGVKNLPMESGGKLSSEDVSSKTECDSMASKIAARFTDHNPSRSDRQQKQSCAFGNPCKQSHPIPIAHSPLREALASCASKALNSNQPSSRDPSHLGRASLKKNTEDGEEVERCVFSLLTASPGTYDGAEYVSFCTMDFLEACFLCKRHLGHGRDIFMYRGDKAFCSVECRQQQIVIDEHAELGKKYLSAVHKRGASVQSRRSNHRTKVLAVSTAAAA